MPGKRSNWSISLARGRVKPLSSPPQLFRI
jgi:hypothetical protein